MQQETLTTSEVSVREYIDVFRRRKAILLQTFVLVFVVGLLVTFMTKPLYRTGARMLVEGKSNAVTQLDSSNPLSTLFSADTGHDVDTQLEVLQGDRVIADTYEKTGIPKDTVRLQAKQVGGTDLIDITAESTSPGNAQRFARALPDVYRNYVTGNRHNEIVNALTFAKSQLDKEVKALDKAETAMEHFRENSQIPEIATERAARITNKMAAESDAQKTGSTIAGLQARVRQLEKDQQALPPFVETPTTTANPQQQLLRDQIATLETQRQGLLVNFKPTHTKVQEVDAQLAHLNQRLAQATDKTTQVVRAPNPAIATFAEKVAAARTDLADALAHRADMRKYVTNDANGLTRFSKLTQQETHLQRDLDRHQTAYTGLAKSVDDLTMREKASHDPVVIISPASPALKVAPKPLSNLLFAAVAGLVLGLSFALLQEFMDDAINTPDEARQIFGAPALGYIPLIEDANARRLGQVNSGNLLETYRVLRTNVSFSAIGTDSDDETPLQSLLVTSTIPGEGKSLTAYNLAVAMALDGKRVILVDADLRRPTVHKTCGLERHPGLTSVLVGNLSLEEALQDTSVPHLRALTAGPLPPNPTEILNSHAMRTLHTSLRSQADMIIFDTPPCLATVDAQVLSADVDGVLYVAEFGETKKSALRRAAEMLKQSHAHILGVVFNKIDTSGKRDDYYSGYYRYYNYYNEDGSHSEEGSARSLPASAFDLLVQPRNGTDAVIATERLPKSSALTAQADHPKDNDNHANNHADKETNV